MRETNETRCMRPEERQRTLYDSFKDGVVEKTSESDLGTKWFLSGPSTGVKESKDELLWRSLFAKSWRNGERSGNRTK